MISPLLWAIVALVLGEVAGTLLGARLGAGLGSALVGTQLGALLAAVVWWWAHPRAESDPAPQGRDWLQAALLGLGTPLLAAAVAGALELRPVLAPGESTEALTDVLSEPGRERVLALVAALLLAPLSEEVRFRLVLWRAVAMTFPRSGLWFVAVVTGTLFAGVHGDPYHVLVVVPTAVALSWLRLRTGSPWPGVLTHTVHNLVALRWLGRPPPDAGGVLLAFVLGAAVVALAARAGRR